VLGFFLREYSRYCPDLSFRIMLPLLEMMHTASNRVALRSSLRKETLRASASPRVKWVGLCRRPCSEFRNMRAPRAMLQLLRGEGRHVAMQSGNPIRTL
jgi:hypothetical protein